MSDFPSTGVSANFEPDIDDDEYLDRLTAKHKPRQVAANPLPIAEIIRSLQQRPTTAPEGTEAYMRERLSDRVQCALCNYDHWNRFELGKHYGNHPEVKQYIQGAFDAARSLDALREAKVRNDEAVLRLKRERQEIEYKIRSIDPMALAARKRQARELLRLLGS